MVVEQFRRDVRNGRIDAERPADPVVTLKRELQRAKQRVEELEREQGGPPGAKGTGPFSVRAEQRRHEARGK